MCNELPLCKESIVVFIRYIGNKDTSAVYPKSLQVNRKNVLDALQWLKKHNPFYADVSIKEENLDRMQGEEKVSIVTNALELKTKNSKQFKIIAGRSENVSFAHNTGLEELQNITDDYKYNSKTTKVHEDNDCTDLDISTMHANQKDPLPTGTNAEIIKSFIDIAQTTDQAAKIMNFPPIDHDSPIW
jgi:hypothetical protein